jgi:hypothetical protein
MAHFSKLWVDDFSQTTAGTLLLVCGEELSRRVLKVVLEAAGYAVLEAVTVTEGMRQAARACERPELALVVAGLEGGIWASLDLLRSALVGAPLLVMSPEEVGWLLDTLDGSETGSQGPWLERVRLTLKQGCHESRLALNLA